MNRLPARLSPCRRAAGWLLLLAALGGWLAVSASAALPLPSVASAEQREYQVKGAFLTKFALFTEWPAGSFTNGKAPVVIGVMRPGFLGAEYEDALKGQTANGRPFVLRHVQNPEDLAGCHIFFANGSSRGRTAELLARVKGAPVLTVGETPDVLALGGVIRFYKEEGRVRFEINVDAAARAGLKISSRLLQLARIVRDPPAPGKK